MKYLLLHNFDDLTLKNLINSYLKEGFKVMFENDKDILLKKGDLKIADEDKYIKITISFLKRSSMVMSSKGAVIDLTEAFNYASTKNGYSNFGNKFDWYLRNIIIREMDNFL